jgi:hypothetical protein
MANTPLLPITERDTAILLEDLCLALRDVGVRDSALPSDPRVVQAIKEVVLIHCELDRRRVDIRERLLTLSRETKWRMLDLLDDCLAFPNVVPYVREEDGIRRRLRCTICGKEERPPNAQFWMCDNCLKRVIEAIESKTPIDRIILFRTFNTGARCSHADSETVLATETWQDIIFGNCVKCFAEELQRRASGPKTPTDL